MKYNYNIMQGTNLLVSENFNEYLGCDPIATLVASDDLMVTDIKTIELMTLGLNLDKIPMIKPFLFFLVRKGWSVKANLNSTSRDYLTKKWKIMYQQRYAVDPWNGKRDKCQVNNTMVQYCVRSAFKCLRDVYSYCLMNEYLRLKIGVKPLRRIKNLLAIMRLDDISVAGSVESWRIKTPEELFEETIESSEYFGGFVAQWGENFDDWKQLFVGLYTKITGAVNTLVAAFMNFTVSSFWTAIKGVLSSCMQYINQFARTIGFMMVQLGRYIFPFLASFCFSYIVYYTVFKIMFYMIDKNPLLYIIRKLSKFFSHLMGYEYEEESEADLILIDVIETISGETFVKLDENSTRMDIGGKTFLSVHTRPGYSSKKEHGNVYTGLDLTKLKQKTFEAQGGHSSSPITSLIAFAISVATGMTGCAKTVGDFLSRSRAGNDMITFVVDNVRIIFCAIAYFITGDASWKEPDMITDLTKTIEKVCEFKSDSNLQYKIDHDKIFGLNIIEECDLVTKQWPMVARETSIPQGFKVSFKDAMVYYQLLRDKVLASQCVNKARAEPAWLHMVGTTAQGKSTLISALQRCIKVKLVQYYEANPELVRPRYLIDSKAASSDIYIYDQNSEHRDGYHNQMICQFDELFAAQSEVIRIGTAVQLLNMINTVPCAFTAAELTLKDKLFFNSPLVVSTSNVFGFVGCGLSSPDALSRRCSFPFEVTRTTLSIKNVCLYCDDKNEKRLKCEYCNKKGFTVTDPNRGWNLRLLHPKEFSFTLPEHLQATWPGPYLRKKVDEFFIDTTGMRWNGIDKFPVAMRVFTVEELSEAIADWIFRSNTGSSLADALADYSWEAQGDNMERPESSSSSSLDDDLPNFIDLVEGPDFVGHEDFPEEICDRALDNVFTKEALIQVKTPEVSFTDEPEELEERIRINDKRNELFANARTTYTELDWWVNVVEIERKYPHKPAHLRTWLDNFTSNFTDNRTAPVKLHDRLRANKTTTVEAVDSDSFSQENFDAFLRSLDTTECLSEKEFAQVAEFLRSLRLLLKIGDFTVFRFYFEWLCTLPREVYIKVEHNNLGFDYMMRVVAVKFPDIYRSAGLAVNRGFVPFEEFFNVVWLLMECRVEDFGNLEHFHRSQHFLETWCIILRYWKNWEYQGHEMIVAKFFAPPVFENEQWIGVVDGIDYESKALDPWYMISPQNSNKFKLLGAVVGVSIGVGTAIWIVLKFSTLIGNVFKNLQNMIKGILGFDTSKEDRIEQEFEAQSLNRGVRAKIAALKPKTVMGKSLVFEGQTGNIHEELSPYAQHLKAVFRNIRYITVMFQNKRVCKGYGLFIATSQLVFPAHITRGEIIQGIQIHNDEPGSGNIVPAELFHVKDFSKEGRDLVRITFMPHIMHKAKSLRNRFFKQPPSVLHSLSKLQKCVVKYDEDKFSSLYSRVLYSGMSMARFCSEPVPNVTSDGYTTPECKGYYILTHARGRSGDCALPYVTEDNPVGMIPGIHVASHKEDAIICPLYYGDVLSPDEVAQIFDLSVAQYNTSKDPVWLKMREFPLAQCDPMFEQPTLPGINTAGLLASVVVTPTETCMKPTPFNKGPGESICTYSVAPAKLKPEIVDGVRMDPFKKNLKFDRTQGHVFHPHASRWLKYPQKYYTGFYRGRIEQTRRLTPEEALFGSYELGVDPMPDDTAPGYYTDLTQQERHVDKPRSLLFDRTNNTIADHFTKRLDWLQTQGRKGKVPVQITCACKKDELRDLQRVRDFNTRIFYVTSVDHCTWLKQVYGHMATVLKQHWSDGASTVGCNPHSNDWKRILELVSKFPNFLGGDCSCYDTSERNIFLSLFIEFSNQFYNYKKGSPEYLELCCAAQSMFGVFILWMNGVYLADYSNASGQWLTSLINSFVIFVSHRILFYELMPKNKALDFGEHVAIVVNGDDNLGSVSDEVASWYNMITLSFGFWEYFGMLYTTPTKGAVSVPFLDRTELTFLGRDFVVEPQSGYVLCPLRITAIEGMLLWTTDKRGELSVFEQNLGNVMMESYHHGQEFYEEMSHQIVDWLNKEKVPINWVPRKYAYWKNRHMTMYFSDDFVPHPEALLVID